MAPKPGDFKSSIYTRATSLIKSKFTKLQATVSALASQQDPLTEVQLKQLNNYASELKRKKAEFENNLQRALNLEGDDAIEDKVLSKDQDEIEELFSFISATIEVLLPPEVPKTPSAISDVSTSTATPASHIRLPQLDLQKFSGDPLQWTSFINLFDTTIHRNASLSSVMKFQYLLSVLSNEPLGLVKSLTLSAANYVIAYDLLRERYHNTRRLQSLHLNQILDLPQISATSLKGLRQFVNLYTEHTQALTALDCNVSTDNPLLSALLLRKMDTELRKKLEAFRSVSADDAPAHTLPSASDIIRFLNTECSQSEDASIHNVSHPTARSSSHPPKPDPHKRVHFRTSDVTLVATQTGQASPRNNDKEVCFACDSTTHRIYGCEVFRNKSPHDRHAIVKQQRRCFSCLGNHEIKHCHSESNCRKCNKKHHTMLHLPPPTAPQASHSVSATEKFRPPLNQGKPNENKLKPDTTSVTLTSQYHPPAQSHTVLLGTTLVKLTSSQGVSHVFRALLDCGSQCELMTERAAQMLGVKRVKSDMNLTGLGQNIAKVKGQAYLNIETLAGDMISAQNPMIILDNITVDLPRTPLSPEVRELTQNYCLADPTYHLPGKIDVVLGSSIFPKILTNEQHPLGHNLPSAIGTVFGYILMGTTPCAAPSPPPPTPSSTHICVSLHVATDADLHEYLKRFWIQEQPPADKKKLEEEELCDRSFQDTHTRNPDGRYVVRLPFKETHPPLGTSRPAAERRFSALERKLNSQPNFSDLYHNFMDEYRSLGHMKKCATVPDNIPHYYLPHHGILKESSSTTKLRTVFDGSAKSSTGVSLNDILFTGKKLQNNICDVLSQFRCHNIVLSCDIRQMYRQIVIHPDDRRFQLILWRDSPDEPISTYSLTTVTYGLNSSPYLAIKALHQLADDEGSAYPDAARVLKTATYVDDIITGADTEEEATSIQHQLIQLLQKGGFELRKWVSNSSSLLQSLPEGHRETPVFLQESQQPHFSILGLHWSPEDDCFSYHLNLTPDARPTKRSVLSVIAKIYDPCGFLAPFVMQAKCFMQFLWTTGHSWDAPLPLEYANKWQNFMADTQSIARISIPRAFQFSSSCVIELHGFADASENGYAAVVYFRCQKSDNSVVIRPIMAKTRVAPLKRVTLPRLELCAAHLLAQLVAHCQSLFKDQVSSENIYLWSDSSIALTWLRTPPYRLQTYISNRVSQTQELVPLEAWRHIASSDNPADCASRGISASQLVNHPLWWTGPSWFHLPRPQWPASQFVPIDLDSSHELKKTPFVVLTAAPQEEWDFLTAISSWHRLQRITAYILRFVNNCKAAQRTQGPLSPSELSVSRMKIFSLVQKSAFPEDIAAIRKQRDCSTRLQRLRPFIGPDGLLRVGGRLNHTSLPSDSQHPVLLPKKHHVVDLIIDQCHRTHLHSGAQLTQSLLAQSVWILCARSAIRSRIFKCITCFKHKPRNQAPLMGDLPPSRVTPSRPFLSTGTDYCGPFTAKAFNLRSTRHVKVYLCVLICMVTKAVHIEVVTDLTTDGFIAALTRFVSRRGLCSTLYCDCGTNFVGADAALRRLLDNPLRSPAAQAKIHRYTTQQGITFQFNAPASPHMGGIWESAVKSAKHHLRRVMGETVLTLSELITLSTQVEAMLNSRPLTPLSSDPSDLSALTPGHFLIGAPLAAVPEPDLQDVPTNRLIHWQVVQAFQQRIWQRWSTEYLHTLQQRSKWTLQRDNLKIGDLVLVHATSAPLSWPLARVTGVHPGKDGVVRVVDLQTATGHLVRPAVKVFPLPLE